MSHFYHQAPPPLGTTKESQGIFVRPRGEGGAALDGDGLGQVGRRQRPFRRRRAQLDLADLDRHVEVAVLSGEQKVTGLHSSREKQGRLQVEEAVWNGNVESWTVYCT